MENILISVIMANYNTPIDYLKEAIDSVLNQTYSNFELIIIDDASTDESLSYIEGLRDPRIIILKNERNRGPAVSRNRGLAIAKGKYIAIMDSDDISMPNRFQVELDYMESHPDVIVCGSWFEKFGVENKVRKPIIDDFEMYRCQLLFSNTPITLCSPSAMIRKSMLDQNGIRFDESLEKTEDYGLWVDCSKIARFYIIDEVLLKYRTHIQQTSIKDRDVQANYSDLISRRQLQQLGINDCPQENRWRYDIVKDRQDYLNFYSWVKSIKSANIKCSIFPEDILQRYLDNKLKNALKRLPLSEKIKTFFASNRYTMNKFFSLAFNAGRRRLYSHKGKVDFNE